MKFKIIKDNYEIIDLKDYEQLAGPVDKRQWQDKRSAKEFARYLLSNNGDLPKEIEDLIKDYYNNETMILYPEYLTGFGKYGLVHKGPRHHDGLLVGDKFLIGVEAKADEPLDNKYLAEYDESNQRYLGISKYLFGDEPHNHKNVRYQLCSATMATLIEALERNKPIAIVLIISFISKEKTKEKNLERNKKDIQAFKDSLISLGNDQYETPFSKEHNISLFIKTIDIDLD